MAELAATLVHNLDSFTAFARSRLSDPELARDAVQESLIKAMGAETTPEVESEAVRWFYRILRRTIIDLHRRTAARERALEKYQTNLEAAADPEEERLLCGCFERLLPQLPPAYMDLIR